jgi:D-glycerate 3-kinase
MVRDASTHGYPDAVVASAAAALRARLFGGLEQRLVGISGLQGSGKSTLAAQLAETLTQTGTDTVVMSLDDFYFGRRERARLARDVHPLFATRGVPGTHDLELIARTFAALHHASAAHPALIPRFDKGRDTRLPRARWRVVRARPQLVLFEGWCVGVPAQGPAALRRPINELERDEDADGIWRGYVNAQLQDGYASLWRRFDMLVLLQAPAFSVVERWRNEQEQTLRRAHAPRAMSPAKLHRFIMHYERLSRHSLRTLPALADVRLVLAADRGVRRIDTDTDIDYPADRIPI